MQKIMDSTIGAFAVIMIIMIVFYVFLLGTLAIIDQGNISEHAKCVIQYSESACAHLALGG